VRIVAGTKPHHFAAGAAPGEHDFHYRSKRLPYEFLYRTLAWHIGLLPGGAGETYVYVQ
jgi:hypothetical protein